MDSKEKAIELIERFADLSRNNKTSILTSFQYDKQCALICVNEVIKSNPTVIKEQLHGANQVWNSTNYWQEVKTEIENL